MVASQHNNSKFYPLNWSLFPNTHDGQNTMGWDNLYDVSFVVTEGNEIESN